MISLTSSKYLKGAAALAVFSTLLIPAVASAFVFRVGDQINVPASETISDDLYAAGGSVTISGMVTGDLVAGGGTVLASAPIGKDAMLGGGTVTVIGNVGESVRIGGGTVTITGSVGKDVLIAGGSVNINGSAVGGDVAIGGGSVTINSPVAGNIRVAGGDVHLNAPIKGSVFMKGGKLTLGSAAVISGNLTYSSAEKVIMDDGAKVLGETKFTEEKAATVGKGVAAGIVSFFLIMKFLSFLVLALLFGYVFKRYSVKMTETALSSPLREFGRGAITMIVLPIASAILFVTLLGIPLGIIGILSFIMLMIISAIVTPIVIGSFIHKKWKKPEGYVVSSKTTILGVLVYFVLSFIPLLGWLAICIATLITAGAIINMKWQIVKEWM